jgi:hypothetical protein
MRTLDSRADSRIDNGRWRDLERAGSARGFGTGEAGVGQPTSVAIALVKPGDVWGDRVNALDLRFAKILRFGRTRYDVGIDVINVTNSDAVLSYNQNYVPNPATPAQRWLAPSSVLTPRFVKLGAQIDF